MPRRDPKARSEYNRAYRAANKERLDAAEHDRYHNKGGKEAQRINRQANLDRYAFYQRESRRKNPKEHILMAAKGRAKRDGVPFDITIEDLEWPEYCPILKIKLDYDETPPGQRRKRHANPTPDRRINHLGYVKGNTFIISHRANRLKSDATIEEIRAILAYMEVAQHAAEDQKTIRDLSAELRELKAR